MKKVLIVVGIAFLIGYFGGFGEMFREEAEATTNGYYDEVNIPYIATSLDTVSPTDVVYFANYLKDNSFKMPNGKIGKIPYFWGGKATDIDLTTGLDNNFLSIALEHSPTYGDRYRPYGLDCSGYVVYVMWLSGYKTFPDGSQNMYDTFVDTDVANVKTGDLAFIDSLGVTSHVGIVSIEDGVKYVYHCEGGNGIVKTALDETLTTYFTWLKTNPYVN